MTKLVLATATAVAAVIVGGVLGPLVIVLVAVVVPALVARVLRRLVATSLLVSLPIGLSALLVNVFFFPGATDVIAQVGPFAATREGLGFAVQILARLAAISGGITLFYLTTRPGDLVLDLERRGISGRAAFVANASVQTVPRILELAGSIVAAQRARGLDTEGSLGRRLSGVVPIVGPVILGSIADVEERTMALEARGFTRPGRRTLLWWPDDLPAERVARWLLALTPAALLTARVAGWLG